MAVFALLLGTVAAACASPLPSALPNGAASPAGPGTAGPPARPSSPAAATAPGLSATAPGLSTPATVTAAPVTSAPVTPVPAPSGGVLDRMRSALEEATGGVVLDLAPDTGPGSAQLDGTADDGGGPGRLLAVASSAGITTGGDLCLDREFAQGGTCESVALPGGDVLYRRGLVVAKGTRSIVVAIRRADGSGILLESDNFRIPTPAVLTAGQPRPTPTLTRPDPVFTLDELARLAEAVSAATRGCTVPACP